MNLDLLENLIVHYTNQERQKAGLAPLAADQTRLRKAARAHSREMAALNFFSHESPVPAHRTLCDRLRLAGMVLEGSAFGENLCMDYLLNVSGITFYVLRRDGRKYYINSRTRRPVQYRTHDQFARRAVQLLMQSPRHRDNLLKAEYTHIGVGAALGENEGFLSLYVTQNFYGPFGKKEVDHTSGRRNAASKTRIKPSNPFDFQDDFE